MDTICKILNNPSYNKQYNYLNIVFFSTTIQGMPCEQSPVGAIGLVTNCTPGRLYQYYKGMVLYVLCACHQHQDVHYCITKNLQNIIVDKHG